MRSEAAPLRKERPDSASRAGGLAYTESNYPEVSDYDRLGSH